MSDSSDEFDDAKRQAFTLHVNAYWATKNCPMCGHNAWQANAYALIGIVDSPSTQLPALNAAKHLPVVVLSCGTCGNTLFINAIIAGILPRQPNEPKG